MNDIALLEDTLRAYLNRRCRRAYAHDLRNGLQGIFGGVDALTRTARATKPVSVPIEQLIQFVQQAIANHERGLERVLEGVAPEQREPVPVSMRELLSDQVRFLSNDTARNNVRVRLDFDDDLKMSGVVARLRLIALGLLTESIDAMPNGGEIRVSGRTVEGRILFDIADSRSQPPRASFVSDAIQQLVAELSGRIEGKQRPTGGYDVSVELPAS